MTIQRRENIVFHQALIRISMSVVNFRTTVLCLSTSGVKK